MKEAKDDTKETILQTSRLFVRNLAFSCTDEELAELFKPFGEISQVSFLSFLILLGHFSSSEASKMTKWIGTSDSSLRMLIPLGKPIVEKKIWPFFWLSASSFSSYTNASLIFLGDYFAFIYIPCHLATKMNIFIGTSDLLEMLILRENR